MAFQNENMTPRTQLEGFIVRLTPEISKLARGLFARMRARLPGAVQLVYDNYNALVIGFGPTEKPSEAIFSIAVLTRYACLCFLQCGPALRDPKKLLKGSGKLARHIPFTRAEEFDNP